MCRVKFLFLSMCLCFAFRLTAQTDTSLDNYLLTHRYSFHQNADSSLSFVEDGMPQMLLDKMKGKYLFVYGEGWSHALHTNFHIITALTALYANHSLKKFFSESARSWVVTDNIFFNLSGENSATYYPLDNDFFRRSKDEEKKMFGSKISYCAVDFERKQSFAEALKKILQFVDDNKKPELYKLAPYFIDSAYLHLSEKGFIKWYRRQHDGFNSDSLAFKQIMGKVYPYFSYLMGDPEPSVYHNDRDKEMAEHLLMQVNPIDTNAVYFYDCGAAHSRIGKKQGLNKTAVNRLSNSSALKGRIVVMNLYGEDCLIPGDNWALKFMKGNVLKSFKQAANDNIVVFNLSKLPAKYQYIPRKYGDMLVYVKHQR